MTSHCERYMDRVCEHSMNAHCFLLKMTTVFVL